MFRKIENIVIHCTATRPDAKISSIQNYWRNSLGWRYPGYHYLISSNGFCLQLLNENQVSNGVKGHNQTAINIGYVGGLVRNGINADTRTKEQKRTLLNLIKKLRYRYPHANILGHRDFKGVAKSCPNFNAKEEYKNI
ncbi:N-acetylmuramoyl-L-alanine amidase [Tenacibaculum piscium]|uniref:N-acetylmuramoyl-L-alanine amidase n=1 Tax=Tenacibaculum piscium TaxID=1458515 RepID=UPI001F33C396|nr:N-acetylmuramoyl-L-alanine amidase [Tenacibaculum piscium]